MTGYCKGAKQVSQDERKLLLLLASIIGPSSLPNWREIRDLIASIKDRATDAT